MDDLKHQLLHDGECGPCTKLGRWIGPRMLHGHAVPLQSVDLTGLGVDVERARTDLPYVHADGRVDYGPAAVASALRACGGPMGGLGRVLATAPAQLVAWPVYRLVARNRHRLGGGAGSCSV